MAPVGPLLIIFQKWVTVGTMAALHPSMNNYISKFHGGAKRSWMDAQIIIRHFRSDPFEC